jgi:hypothetical protein
MPLPAAGSRLTFAGTSAEVVVIRAADKAAVVACQAATEQVLLGKRYVDEDEAVELLCVKPGPGVLTVNGRPMLVKKPKPLPASD